MSLKFSFSYDIILSINLYFLSTKILQGIKFIQYWQNRKTSVSSELNKKVNNASGRPLPNTMAANKIDDRKY